MLYISNIKLFVKYFKTPNMYINKIGLIRVEREVNSAQIKKLNNYL